MRFSTLALVVAAMAATANSLQQTINVGGLLATGLKLSDGTLRAIYQASDTSLHVIQPVGLPGHGITDIVILPAGGARNNTPIAATTIFYNNENQVVVYYFSTANGGTELNELVGFNNNTGYATTGFKNLGFASAPGNQLLYAYPYPPGGVYGRRIGFQFPGGHLGEAVCTNVTCWSTALY